MLRDPRAAGVYSWLLTGLFPNPGWLAKRSLARGGGIFRFTLRDGTGQTIICSLFERLRQIDREGYFSFIDREVIGIVPSEAEFVDEHLMLLFRLDMVSDSRFELQPI